MRRRRFASLSEAHQSIGQIVDRRLKTSVGGRELRAKERASSAQGESPGTGQHIHQDINSA